MIFDSIRNFGKYLSLHPHFKDVDDFIKNNDISEMPEGRHQVNGHGAFVLVKEYFTKEISEAFLECHRKFIDIQILAKGAERIGVCNKDGCAEFPYDADKDLQKLEGELNFIKMNLDSFVIFFPDDAHMPELNLSDSQEKVKKIVFKVPVAGFAL
jgi:YhcH/YjgK/YiaL family protein